MNRVAELLGCRYPILQGAMGVICNPELVAAVSEAGGLGLLATAFATDFEAVRAQVRATKKLTRKPFGANLQVMNPRSQDLAQLLVDEGVGAVTISGGSPKALVPFLLEKGLKVLVVVPTVDVARKAETLGAHAIIAEGSESGGIQGFQGASTMVLVPAVADSVKIPVIAAGGIADSRGYRAALALGAEGVQVGTRFIATKECIAHQRYKDALVSASEVGTALLNRVRFQVRALRTPLVEKILSGEAKDLAGFDASSLEAAWVAGDLDAGSLPAGEVAGLIRTIPSAREVIEEMVR